MTRLTVSHSLAFLAGCASFAYGSWLWLDKQHFGL